MQMMYMILTAQSFMKAHLFCSRTGSRKKAVFYSWRLPLLVAAEEMLDIFKTEEKYVLI